MGCNQASDEAPDIQRPDGNLKTYFWGWSSPWLKSWYLLLAGTPRSSPVGFLCELLEYLHDLASDFWVRNPWLRWKPKCFLWPCLGDYTALWLLYSSSYAGPALRQCQQGLQVAREDHWGPSIGRWLQIHTEIKVLRMVRIDLIFGGSFTLKKFYGEDTRVLESHTSKSMQVIFSKP